MFHNYIVFALEDKKFGIWNFWEPDGKIINKCEYLDDSLVKNILSDEIKNLVNTLSRKDIEDLVSMILSIFVYKTRKELIHVQETYFKKSEVQHKKGVYLNEGFLSPYFVNNTELEIVELKDALILMINDKVFNVGNLLPILEDMLKLGRDFLIIANKFSEEVIQTLAVNVEKGTMHCAAIQFSSTDFTNPDETLSEITKNYPDSPEAIKASKLGEEYEEFEKKVLHAIEIFKNDKKTINYLVEYYKITKSDAKYWIEYVVKKKNVISNSGTQTTDEGVVLNAIKPDSADSVIYDINAVTGGRVIPSEYKTLCENATIGQAELVIVNKDNTLIIGIDGEDEIISNRINELEKKLSDKNNLDEIRKDELKERIFLLKKGISLIKIGASSKSEIKTKVDITKFLINHIDNLIHENLIHNQDILDSSSFENLKNEIMSTLLI